MKFEIEASKLVSAKDKIKKVVQNSALVKKSIYLQAGENGLVMYGYSEGFYGEIHVEAEVIKPGVIELNHNALDLFDFTEGKIELELVDPIHISYKNKILNGQLNITTSEPDFQIATKPVNWIKLPPTYLGVLYCNTKDDRNLENVFFFQDTIACTSRYTFAGYKHPQEITSEAFTVPIRFFDLIDKTSETELALDLRKVWIRQGEFLVSAGTIEYTNPVVTEFGYYEFKPLAKFEITIEEAERICGYIQTLSDDGFASLVLHKNKLFVVPTGNSIGPGTMEIECKSSEGEINFGLKAASFLPAIKHVDYGICRVYLANPTKDVFSLVVVGSRTRHLFNEVPHARYNGEASV
jgi:DNA polymerase III sliding clamp (beta) subunit (PCNA family)